MSCVDSRVIRKRLQSEFLQPYFGFTSRWDYLIFPSAKISLNLSNRLCADRTGEIEMAKIVVVDDETMICKYLANRLRKDGHEVKVSETGDGAIDLGHLFKPDIVIADICLNSDYSGLEVIEAIQSVNKNVKIIAITAFPTKELYYHLNTASIESLLIKPFSLSKISETVRQVAFPTIYPTDFSDN